MPFELTRSPQEAYTNKIPTTPATKKLPFKCLTRVVHLSLKTT